MVKTLRLYRWIRITGILVIVLGLMHCAATPMVLAEGRAKMPADLLNVYIYMFLATGLATIGTGLIIALSSRGLAQSKLWSLHLNIGAAGFISILGISAPIAMASNPFAYLTLALALLLDVLLVIHYRTSSQSSGFNV